jgi:hypothetical protein
MASTIDNQGHSSGDWIEETGDCRKSAVFIDSSRVKLSRDGSPIRVGA